MDGGGDGWPGLVFETGWSLICGAAHALPHPSHLLTGLHACPPFCHFSPSRPHAHPPPFRLVHLSACPPAYRPVGSRHHLARPATPCVLLLQEKLDKLTGQAEDPDHISQKVWPFSVSSSDQIWSHGSKFGHMGPNLTASRGAARLESYPPPHPSTLFRPPHNLVRHAHRPPPPLRNRRYARPATAVHRMQAQRELVAAAQREDELRSELLKSQGFCQILSEHLMARGAEVARLSSALAASQRTASEVGVPREKKLLRGLGVS
eukprot:19571-Chlamydomonas_euryale.AAC.9